MPGAGVGCSNFPRCSPYLCGKQLVSDTHGTRLQTHRQPLKKRLVDAGHGDTLCTNRARANGLDAPALADSRREPTDRQPGANVPALCLAGWMEASGKPAGWDGAVNAWHIAGEVYRMGRREWLTETGWRQAHRAGIRTVIDLRNDDEIRRRESDPPVNEAAMAAFDVVYAPTEDPANSEFRDICGPYMNNPADYADYARLFPEHLAGVFKAVAAARGGVVIHCSAGRDRSGVIAAMLQDLAGDSDDAIVLGYQQSARGINEHHRRAGVPHPRERYLPEDLLKPLLDFRRESLLQFVRSLRTEDFLRRNGVSDAELAAVMTKLGSAN